MGFKFWQRASETKGASHTITETRELASAMGISNLSSGGMPVTMTQAIGVVDVLACAKVIGNGLAQVPLKLFKPLPGGGSEPDTSGVGRLLYRQPNPVQTAFRFRKMMGLHLTLGGVFAAYINRVGGEPVELLPLPLGAVENRGTAWEPKYYVDFGNGSPKFVPSENLLYILGDSMDGVAEMPITQYAREAIGLSMATDQHAGKFFRNGGSAGGHYTTDEMPNTEERTAMLEAIKDMEEQSKSLFRRMVLWGGLKYEHTSFSAEQAQLKEIRDQQTEIIARAFGVNPIIIGYQGGKTATFASAEQLFTAHVVYTLGPWYEMIEQELWVQLLTDQQKDAGYEFKHIAQGLMRGSHKDRVEYYSKMRNAGVMDGNEIRDLEDMNPREHGDELWRPVNMAVVGKDNEESEE